MELLKRLTIIRELIKRIHVDRMFVPEYESLFIGCLQVIIMISHNDVLDDIEDAKQDMEVDESKEAHDRPLVKDVDFSS